MADANVSVSFSASIADFVSGVAEAKDALQSFSAPFGEINGQLASFANASSRAFSPDRLHSYHDALAATRSLEQSFAADSVRAAAAMRAGDDEAYADATRAAQLATSEELRILADALKQKLALYGEEARFYEITQQQKLALSQAALDEEYAAELAALQKREALGEQSLAVKQRTDDMIIEATRRRDDETTALTRSALQEQERDYPSFANSIMGAFNSQLRGLLSGTENWHAAFKSVLDDLLIKFIEWCETTVEHDVLAEAMKTAATTTSVAARTSAEDAGAAASLGAAMVRSILSSAAETFAGVFGFLSPLMGPFAAGPAAAARAAVAGMAGSVASADIGMWQAPQDMLTLVHHNELIMPQAEAGAFRSLLTGSASGASPGASVAIHPTTNFNVSALDGRRIRLRHLSRRRRPARTQRPRQPHGPEHLLEPEPRRQRHRLHQLDRAASGAASRMHDGLRRCRLVLQLGRRLDLPNLSLDEFHLGGVSAEYGLRLPAGALDGVEPDGAKLSGPDSDPRDPERAWGAWLRLWRDAKRSIDRSLHSRFKDARFQSRILPVLARNG
jgi:hypothetical protein